MGTETQKQVMKPISNGEVGKRTETSSRAQSASLICSPFRVLVGAGDAAVGRLPITGTVGNNEVLFCAA